MSQKEKLNDILTALDYGQLNLNEWESEFIDSIYGKVMDGKELTWKQIKKLIQIWERVE